MAPQGLRSSNSLQLLGGVLSFNRRENLVFHMDFVIYLKGGGGGGWNAQGLLQHEVNKK